MYTDAVHVLISTALCADIRSFSPFISVDYILLFSSLHHSPAFHVLITPLVHDIISLHYIKCDRFYEQNKIIKTADRGSINQSHCFFNRL